jgi:hypothetical protein
MTDDELRVTLGLLGADPLELEAGLIGYEIERGVACFIHKFKWLVQDAGRYVFIHDDRYAFATAEELLDAVVEYLRSKQCNSTQATSQP